MRTEREEKKPAEKTRRGTGHIEHWQLIAFFLAVYDFIAICVSYFLGLWLRFDCLYSQIPKNFLYPYLQCILPAAVISILIFHFFHMYSGMWRYASLTELTRICLGSLTSSVLHTILITVIKGRMPISYYILGALFQMGLLVVVRFSYRFVQSLKKKQRSEEVKQVMLIGAGSSGQMILRDLSRARKVRYKVVCIIDDNKNKWNRYLNGIPIVGGREEILSSVQKYGIDEIFIAIPSATAQQKRDILAICNETGCKLRQLPGMYQFVTGEITVSAMKEVSIEDLLGRDPIKADLKEVFAFITGKTVMVTGGGGSIGSELCRQIAAHKPKRLIIFDIYENNAYSIQLELKEKYPELDLVTLIGSVRDSRRMFEVFEVYQPQIVYHAAAHKHVPLMEDSPCEAVKNNAIGTYKTAYAAMVHGCERFVLISTDKAVNPTNIMGATKRLCEMIIQSFDKKIKEGKANEIPQLFTHEMLSGKKLKEWNGADAKTEFVAVRFGNVLGSNGSVIPIFKKQIEKGGPVTVTHPDIIRYFMTIPEAASLVMLAGTYAHGGEIFVLDMGSPVKIVDLARNLIRSSGFKPDVDIRIEYTGLRPGEKLFEEKLMSEEGLQKTDNDLIYIGKPLAFDETEFIQNLEQLMAAAYANKEEQIRSLVQTMVSTYHPVQNN